MIEIMPESNASVLAVKAIGILTDADYKEVLIPKTEEIVKAFGNLKVLLYMTGNCDGWQLHAAWDDAAFCLRHRRDFEKIAVVSSSKWVEWGTRLASCLIKGKAKTFPEEQLQEALDWIRL
jgi:hypothetical protein